MSSICEKCKCEININNVKYVSQDEDNYSILCLSCYSGKTPEPPKSTNKIKYFCSRCRYSFSRNPTVKIKCPYCGKEDKVINDDRNVKNIISEVSDPTFDEGNLF